jgi:hypothetical protein
MIDTEKYQPARENMGFDICIFAEKNHMIQNIHANSILQNTFEDIVCK